jgi:DNA invertase Pin-like site-specific DNA recombinase
VKAGVYVRISRDKSGNALGVERQEPPCRDYCTRRGWHVHETYIDNDLSAYSGTRPAFERLLRDAEAGIIGAIVAWDADRLSRDPDKDNGRIIGLAERYGVQLGTVTGDYDLATPMGRRFFRIRGADARWESEHRAERVALKHAELRANGKYWGGQRPFGYRVVPVVVDGKIHYRLELDEAEAELTRAAARRVLTGGSLSAVVRDWSTRRPPVLRPRGRLWDSGKLRELLISPRIAGLRQNGTDLVEADWPAIITREEHEQLRAILAERPTQKGPKEPRDYLASGVYICDLCGTPMIGQARMGTPAYACRRERGGCGRLHRVAKPLDDYLRDAVLDALSSPKTRAKLVALHGADHAGEAAALVAKRKAALTRLAVLRKAAGDPETDFDPDDFAVAKRQVQVQIDGATTRLAELQATNTLADLPDTIEELERLWAAADRDRRRALVKLVVSEVIVMAPGGGKRFQPAAFTGEDVARHVAEHLEIIWRF